MGQRVKVVTQTNWHKVALVVDDEPFARLFATQIFLDHGFFVIEAGDAAEGLAMLDDNHDVSVLFTDISMPGGMDGLELVDRVRAKWPAISVVVTSGRVRPSTDRLPSPGSFLPKPYTAHALGECIRDIQSASA